VGGNRRNGMTLAGEGDVAMRVGVVVECTVCGQRKSPRGRSAPLGSYLCDWQCDGYDKDPQVGDLWPRETEEEFGYPVSANGTEEVQ
jgi:hypothetical protein